MFLLCAYILMKAPLGLINETQLLKIVWKKGNKNNEAPEGINTTYLDTRVDNEREKRNIQTKEGPFH